MALYTFYPCRLDDVSLCFEAHELADDAAAARRADAVLRDHDSAAFVVVYCDERSVMTRARARPRATVGRARERAAAP